MSSSLPPALWLVLLPSPQLVVYLVRFVPLQGVLSLSETCSTLHALIEDPLGSRSLWRALFLDTFDDPRSSASHRRQVRAGDGRPQPEAEWRHLLRTCTVSLRRAERALWARFSSQADDQVRLVVCSRLNTRAPMLIRLETSILSFAPDPAPRKSTRHVRLPSLPARHLGPTSSAVAQPARPLPHRRHHLPHSTCPCSTISPSVIPPAACPTARFETTSHLAG